MNFCWCTISAADFEKSLQFYTEIIGLPVTRRMAAGPGVEIAFLGEGETKVEIIGGRKEPAEKEGISLGFEVASLDETMDFIKGKGIPVDGGPFQPNPHVRFFYVRDPDGVKIQFVENM